MVVDAALVCLALAFATWLRPFLAFLPFAQEYPSHIPTPWLVYPVFVIEWVGVFLVFSIYDGRRHLRWVDEFTSLTLATLLASFALAGTLFLSFRMVSRLLFISFMTMAYGMVLSWRWLARRYSRVGEGGRMLRRVLVVGAGVVGRELQSQIVAGPANGLELIGFLDDDPNKLIDQDVLGSLDDAQKTIMDLDVQDVVIALPQRAYQRMNGLVRALHRLPVQVWVIPDYFRLTLFRASVEQFAGFPIMGLRSPALNENQRLSKRLFDLVVAILLMPVALVLMGFIVIALRLESRGPALFLQKRVGENGEIFQMYKFRTMELGAQDRQHEVEELNSDGQIIHKRSEDPRVTRVGRFLRRSSLDELPQLFNVLRGEMSLVGPRPELPYLVDNYEPWQRQRFAVPQGITGWWQVSGRSEKPMHLNTEDDLYYVQNYSVLLDIYILLKTIGVVIRGDGAF